MAAEIFSETFSTFDPTLYLVVVALLTAEILIVIVPIVTTVRADAMRVSQHLPFLCTVLLHVVRSHCSQHSLCEPLCLWSPAY